VKVTADRQTLILAGEKPPRRAGIAAGQLVSGPRDGADDTESAIEGQHSSQLTIISARVDAIVTQAIYTPNNIVSTYSGGQSATLANYSAALPSASPKLQQAYVISTRGASSAANAYARTRDLADRAPALVDTYA
jgi:hypothetical protein